MGVEGLKPTSRNKGYSSELKNASVADYLAGNGSLLEICKKYRIRSVKQLWDWIVKYNGHKELKPSRTGGKKIMTKGRKTTKETYESG